MKMKLKVVLKPCDERGFLVYVQALYGALGLFGSAGRKIFHILCP